MSRRPVKRLCHNVILRLKPKNLSFITHRFYEILRGVYPEPKIETLRFTQGDSGEGFRMTNLHFKVIATQSPRDCVAIIAEKGDERRSFIC